MRTRRVCVVGGGISGLTAAYRLKQAGAQVELFEAAPRVGGILGSERIDDCLVETGPDSILTEKPWALALAKELGLEQSLIRTRTSPRGAYVVHQGRLERVPEGFSMMAPTDPVAMLRSPLLSAKGKLRMGLDLLLPRGAGLRARASDDESLESFVVRRLGRETLDHLAQPLVGGVYGADPASLSLRATMPRFLELERSHRSVILGLRARQRAAAAQGQGGASGARYGMFVAFREGMQELVDALASRLDGALQLERAVTAIERDPDGYRVEVRGAWHAYDAVIVALPAHVAGQALYSLDRPLADELLAIDYASAATVTFAWDRKDVPHPLDAFGFVVPAREPCEILASTWASVKYEGRAPADRALIRVFVGGFKGQARAELPEPELIRLVRRELAALMGIRAEPRFTRVVRYRRAMPQYCVGHLARVARIEERERTLTRFALAGNAYRGVGIPDAVNSGERASKRVLEDLAPAR
jgi:oxygen-dependent protoporphyrinogen oxidase